MASPGHNAIGIVKVATPPREAEMNRILMAHRLREQLDGFLGDIFSCFSKPLPKPPLNPANGVQLTWPFLPA